MGLSCLTLPAAFGMPGTAATKGLRQDGRVTDVISDSSWGHS